MKNKEDVKTTESLNDAKVMERLKKILNSKQLKILKDQYEVKKN